MTAPFGEMDMEEDKVRRHKNDGHLNSRGAVPHAGGAAERWSLELHDTKNEEPRNPSTCVLRSQLCCIIPSLPRLLQPWPHSLAGSLARAPSPPLPPLHIGSPPARWPANGCRLRVDHRKPTSRRRPRAVPSNCLPTAVREQPSGAFALCPLTRAPPLNYA